MSDPLAVLRQLREARPAASARAGERCELCGEEIAEEHGHLVDLRARNLLCACRGCYLLFTSDGAGGGHYRAVPRRYEHLSQLSISGQRWDALQIPVGVAFFFLNSDLGRVAAFYPGPAGATESLLALETWDDLWGGDPPLSARIEADVEALLVRADRRGHFDAFIVPIDACYELVGRLRQLWRGFDGGKEAHLALEGFFSQVEARAT